MCLCCVCVCFVFSTLSIYGMPTFGTYGNCSHDDRMGKMHLAIDNETLNRSLSTRLIAKNGTDNLMVGRRYNYNYNIA